LAKIECFENILSNRNTAVILLQLQNYFGPMVHCELLIEIQDASLGVKRINKIFFSCFM
jgi:hypothetical protein